MKNLFKILSVTVVAVMIAGAVVAQSIPSASPANNPLIKKSANTANVNHNALTNTGTFTNVVIPVIPNQPFDLWVKITNCPSLGVMTYHFDASTDNGVTYTALGLASNGVYQVSANFNTNTSAGDFLFKTNYAASTIPGVTHLKLTRAAGTTATNVYTLTAGVTQPAPIPY